MKKVSLYGASGHAKVIFEILQAQKREIDLIYDDDQSKNQFMGRKVSHSVAQDKTWILSIGDNSVRKLLDETLQLRYTSAIHPSSQIAPSAKYLEGTVIMAGAVVNSCTLIGRHCIINTNSIVDHDCSVADYVHISPCATLCGDVHIGEGSHIGAGATIIPGVIVGKNCIIGAGSVVIRDIPDNSRVVGNPSRFLVT